MMDWGNLFSLYRVKCRSLQRLCKIHLSISSQKKKLTIQAEVPSLYRPETQEIKACQTKLKVKAPVIDIGM
jgi:hypothetical protein